MSDQVQHLIDRIRKDAVSAAEQQAGTILAEARAKAERIVAEADAKAAATVRAAEQQGKEFAERGERGLQHAARDLLIAVGQAVERIVKQLVTDRAHDALKVEVVEQMLIRLADGFARNGVSEGQIDILISAADREPLVRFAMTELRKRLEQGVDLKVDPRLDRGFRISYAKGAIHHDFTPKAVAEALARFVSPQLADVVMKAALDPRGGGKT